MYMAGLVFAVQEPISIRKKKHSFLQIDLKAQMGASAAATSGMFQGSDHLLNVPPSFRNLYTYVYFFAKTRFHPQPHTCGVP